MPPKSLPLTTPTLRSSSQLQQSKLKLKKPNSTAADATPDRPERALRIQQPHADRIFTPIDKDKKRMEIKSYNLKCVDTLERFWIATGGGKNSHGIPVVELLGQVTFHGNQPIPTDDILLPKWQSMHKATKTEFDAVFSKRKKPQQYVGWNIDEAERCQPLYLPWNREDPCKHKVNK